MSKRFGRTQKRKMRERIARLQESNKMNESMAKWHSDERSKYIDLYNELINDIRRWWGNSVLEKPRKEVVNHIPPYYRKAMYGNGLFYKNMEGQSLTSYSKMDIHFQTLKVLRVASMMDLESRHMHIEVVNGEGRISYYIDPKTFFTFNGMPGQVRKHVCGMILHEFDCQLQKLVAKHATSV